MAAVIDCLKSINAYPIPLRTLVETAENRCLDLNEQTSPELMQSKEYNFVKADLYLWLSFAPDVSQGGQSFSFTDEQRTRLRSQAKALYAEFEPNGAVSQKSIYGYKGSRL